MKILEHLPEIFGLLFCGNWGNLVFWNKNFILKRLKITEVDLIYRNQDEQSFECFLSELAQRGRRPGAFY